MDEFMLAAIAEARTGATRGWHPDRSVLVHAATSSAAATTAASRRAAHPARRDGRPRKRRPAARPVYRESVIYTTLSPCAMCTGAILL